MLDSSNTVTEDTLSIAISRFQSYFGADTIILYSLHEILFLGESYLREEIEQVSLEKLALQITSKINDKVFVHRGVVSNSEVCCYFLSFNVSFNEGNRGQLVLLRENKPLDNTHNLNFISDSGLWAQYITSAALIVKKEAEKTEAHKSAVAEPRIMLVDDIEINRIVGEMLLCELGFTADHAKNGEEAVELCKRFKYDLILMDYNMPIMNGPEAVKRIKEVVTYPVKVIACTSDESEEVRQSCFDAGMSGIVIKPLTQEKLRKIVFSTVS
ncbi:response regulator [Alteromonas sp. KUL106]|uniref:response regulator n=1 Tax=Alteromonas sp. KUL106 TaxID=2480799 RepID=UPI0012E43D1F|nr:response regulator [Alteromonas sp. KUL106]GFD68660.1 hypothetical protein KUL106_19230 [Alteromonas sp. KUL106]